MFRATATCPYCHEKMDLLPRELTLLLLRFAVAFPVGALFAYFGLGIGMAMNHETAATLLFGAVGFGIAFYWSRRLERWRDDPECPGCHRFVSPEILKL